MQCASCRFENMPGVEACGRCGSPLGLGNLAVDIHPPRAAPWVKRMRRLLPFRSLLHRTREIGKQQLFEDLEDAPLWGVPIEIFIRMLIPGWAHIYFGQFVPGFRFLGIWIVLLVAALVSSYVTLSGISLDQRINEHHLADLWGGLLLWGICVGLAFSVHLASCVSLARLDGLNNREFWSGGGRRLAQILGGLYLLSSWLFFYFLLWNA